MNLNPAIIQPCVFLLVSGAAYVTVRLLWNDDARVEERIQDLHRPGTPGGKGSRTSLVTSRVVNAALPRLASRLLPNDQRERVLLQSRLMHAGIYTPWALPALLIAKIVLMIVPPIVGLVLGQMGLFEANYALLSGAIVGWCGLALPGFWLDRRKTQRHAVLSRSLRDFLDLMMTCVESGLSLQAALQRVTDELKLAHPVLAGEMAVVQRQMELGATADEALSSFGERSDFEPIYSLAALIKESRRFGTSTVDALRIQSESLRFDREQWAEEMAQKAAVKILMPTLLFIFPAIFVVLVGPAVIQLNEHFSPKAEAHEVQAQ